MSEDIEAVSRTEEVWGVVQCNGYNDDATVCTYWGRMTGYIQPDNKKVITFVCPECNSVEDIKNPEAI
jgi:hypothetical protein